MYPFGGRSYPSGPPHKEARSNSPSRSLDTPDQRPPRPTHTNGLPSPSPMKSPTPSAPSFTSSSASLSSPASSSSPSSAGWESSKASGSMLPPPTSATREDVAPWESHSSLPTSLKPPKPSSSPAHTFSPTITSKLIPPPTSPPTSLPSPSKGHLQPPSSARTPAVASVLHRSFSQRPPSLVHAFASRTVEGGGARNFSDPTAGRRQLSSSPAVVAIAESSTVAKGATYLVNHDDDHVRDQEALMAETMRFCVSSSGSDTFVELGEGEKVPSRVLDIGCGMGLWCISQAQTWPASTFVGLDVASSHVDLDALAQLQVETGGAREGGVDWQDVQSRIEWCQADFLETLPFDSGSFDLVHIRWISLGVPEPKWQELLEEAARVLKKGTGILEIVETSNTLPPPPPAPSPPPPMSAPSAYFTSRPRSRQTHLSDPTSTPRHTPSSSLSGSPVAPAPPPSQQQQYAQHLQTHLIQPTPNVVIRPAFLMTTGLSKMRSKKEDVWVRDEVAGVADMKAPGVLSEASSIWAESMFPTPPATPTSFLPLPPTTLPSPYVNQTAHLLATELAETYGLEGYATRVPRAADSPNRRGKFSRKVHGLMHGNGTGGGGGVVAGGGNGGRVESWAWVGRKSA